MDLLELMYNGKFPPFYALNLWNEEYAKLVSEYAETENKIIETCPEVKELFEHYQEIQSKINTIMQYREFRNGFRIGAQLMEEMKKPLDYPKK